MQQQYMNIYHQSNDIVIVRHLNVNRIVP